MEGNLDSIEIASRESGKVFHCLRGDGGILCGSLSGITALEGDTVVGFTLINVDQILNF